MLDPRIQINGNTYQRIKIVKKNNKGKNIHEISLPDHEGDQLTVDYYLPLIDTHYVWHPTSDGRVTLNNEWDEAIEYRLNQSMPVLSFFNQENENKYSIALDDLLSNISISAGVHEETASIKISISLLVPNADYRLLVSLSQKEDLWSKVLNEQVEWLYKVNNITPKVVPKAALSPVLSTWYSFHQHIDANSILTEAKNYHQLGARTIIVDDGWQTDDGGRRYAYAGDWNVSTNKFPDFQKHITSVKSLGISYLLWLSLPFLGIKSQQWERLKDKITYLDEFQRAGVLDISEEVVQTYLVDTVQKTISSYPVDGLKLDFFETFYKPNDSSRSISLGLIQLLEKIETIIPKNRDFFIEYRQDYINPLMMTFCNIIRAKDCPNNLLLNRVRTIDLRISCPYTAVHSDMIMWNEKETVEGVALQFINVLFSIPQLSVLFEKMSSEEKKMISFWFDFMKENQQLLLASELIPLFPHEGYSQVHSYAIERGIIVNYSEGKLINPLRKTAELILVNGTLTKNSIVQLLAGKYLISIKDCLGENVKNYKINVSSERPIQIEIPRSGVAQILLKG